MTETSDELELSPDAMRALGHRVVDAIVDHVSSLREQRPMPSVTRRELEDSLWEPPPEGGRDPMAVLERVLVDVMPNVARVNHPRYLAHIPPQSTFVGALADALASGFGVFAGSWENGPAAAVVELVTLDWLRRALDMPDGASGLFVSGGTAANLHALHTARHARLGGHRSDAVIYLSDQTHPAVLRAIRVLGFEPEQVRRLPTDGTFRVRPADIEGALAEDRRAGRAPLCVVANGGTAATGAVDPLEEIADLCAAEGLWLHVDGAFGAPAVLCSEGRRRLAGIGRADSVALDPHKWLFQPLEIGCVLVAEPAHLEDAFRFAPPAPEVVNFMDRGLQLSRGFRALKMWMTIQVYGMDGLSRAVERGVRLAARAAEMVDAHPGWELYAPPGLGVVVFGRTSDGRDDEAQNALHRDLAVRCTAAGRAVIAPTVLHGRVGLRLCTINPRTREEDIRAVLDELDGLVGGGGVAS